jgi:3-oxoacyl-[acyl-carrier protein] reductase
MSPPRVELPLHDRRAVVTGSSRGIGRSIAVALAAAGARVVLHGRDAAALAEAAAAVGAVGAEPQRIVAPLDDAAGCDALLGDALAGGPVDVWVNNAGTDVLTGAARTWTFEEKLAALWRVDVAATVRLSRAVGRHMQDRGQGVVLNMGWDQAETGMEGDSGEMFAAVKGAVMAFTRSLAHSLAPAVRVNCLAPGWIRTAWGSDADPRWQRRAVGESLRGRWGTADDVAAAAVWLASPAADFVNGQIIRVNGGFRHAWPVE